MRPLGHFVPPRAFHPVRLLLHGFFSSLSVRSLEPRAHMGAVLDSSTSATPLADAVTLAPEPER